MSEFHIKNIWKMTFNYDISKQAQEVTFSREAV